MTMQEIYEKYKMSSGVSIDTRTLQKDEIFFALKGPHFNGNKYASQAISAGARYVVVDDPKYYIDDERYILVNDALNTLQLLAKYHRSRINSSVFVLTGSNGKTTTKELIKSILSTTYHVSATKGNLNNNIGVPLTLLRADESADIHIVEIGTNQPGDILELCELVEPTLGMITNIGESHLERLGDIQGVFEEKSELFYFLERRNFIFFLNDGDSFLRSLSSEQLIRYNKTSNPVGDLSVLDSDAEFLELSLTSESAIYNLKTQLIGSYNIENISAAMTVGWYFSVSLKNMIDGISNYRPDNMRSQYINTLKNDIILDAYNANPTSMLLSISDHVHSIGKDSWIILGDMLELGKHSVDRHQMIITHLEKFECKNVVLVGQLFHSLESSYLSYASVDDMILNFNFQELRDTVILIKGSRGIRLEKVLNHIP